MPKTKTRRRSGTVEALNEFINSGWKYAKVENATVKEAHNLYNLFAYRIERDYRGQVNIYQRGSDIYLERV